MLKDFTRPDDGLTKEERKAAVKDYKARLTAMQQPLRAAGIPIIVLVEGWDSAGKGRLINELISEIDPRFATVFTEDAVTRDADRYPWLYPYFNAIPENGKILFMDSGWMDCSVRSFVKGELEGEAWKERLQSVNRFERTLRDNGYILIKLFLNISKKEQHKRMNALLEDKNTAWRTTDEDVWQNATYDEHRAAFEAFMSCDSEIAPWHVLDSSNRRLVAYDAFRIITETMEAAIAAGRYIGEPVEEEFPMSEEPRLENADLSLTVTDEEYKAELKRLQKKLSEQHDALYRRKIPVVIAYEGWDAAGKGGNIRRVAYPLDPRGFTVWPIASPEPHELARHFLWRFWTRLPRSGHVAIFDRTWYGRVMVERLEGYCSEKDWQRAYNEMNEFEKELTDYGTVVLKFWIQIDNKTQLDRFTMRQNTPEKQWKITDEDWRNREKWPQYEAAIQEMLTKTSTTYAPWHIIESDDKKYARLKVLRIVTDALDKALLGC